VIDYSQPSFYHFNEDSLLLIDYVLHEVGESFDQVLDVGAGCGICGLELSQKARVNELTFLEVQDEFLPYLKKNISTFVDNKTKMNIHLSKVSAFTSQHPFDLIISNPPYFSKSSGRVSPDPQKQICRTWEIDSLETFILSALELTALHGHFIFIQPQAEIKLPTTSSSFRLTKKDLKHVSVFDFHRLDVDRD